MQRQHSTTSSLTRPLTQLPISGALSADLTTPGHFHDDETDLSSVVFRKPTHQKHAGAPSVRIVSLVPSSSGGAARLVPVLAPGQHILRSLSRLQDSRAHLSRSLSRSTEASVQIHSARSLTKTPSVDARTSASAVQESIVEMSSASPVPSPTSASKSIESDILMQEEKPNQSRSSGLKKSASRVQQFKTKRKKCWSALKAINERFGLKHLVLAVIILAYAFIGATLFYFIERPHEQQLTRSRLQEAVGRRDKILDQLKTIYDLNCLDIADQVITPNELIDPQLESGYGSQRSTQNNRGLGKVGDAGSHNPGNVYKYLDEISSNKRSTDKINFRNIRSGQSANLVSIGLTNPGINNRHVGQSDQKAKRSIMTNQKFMIRDNQVDRSIDQNLTNNRSIKYRCRSALRFLLQDYEKRLGVLDSGPKYEWDFWNSMFFAGTIFTTIGYGHMTCRTFWGRLVTVAYALLGIPLMLTFLNGLGDVLFKRARLFWNNIRRYFRRFQRILRAQRREGASVKRSLSRAVSSTSTSRADEPYENFPLVLAIGLVFAYVLACAALFCVWETNWDYWTAVYFFFVSLTTIGFGDIVPDHPRFTILGFVFFIIGLALVSMCINVIQAKVEKHYKYYFDWDEIQNLLASGEDDSRPTSLLITAPTSTSTASLLSSSRHKLSVVPEEMENFYRNRSSLGIIQIVRYPQERSPESSEESGDQPASDLSTTPPPEPEMKSSQSSSSSEGPRYPAAFFEVAKADQERLKTVSGRDEATVTAERPRISSRGVLRRPASLPLATDVPAPKARSKKTTEVVRELQPGHDAAHYRHLRVSFSPSVPSMNNE